MPVYIYIVYTMTVLDYRRNPARNIRKLYMMDQGSVSSVH